MNLRAILLALCALVGTALPLVSTAAGATPVVCKDAWPSFARRFVKADGRVVDTGNRSITHSEGLGVAMLTAQACDDRARFDKIWAFARTLQRGDGLFSWKYVPGTGIADRNNAADGDVYIAWALLRAGRKWDEPALAREAKRIVVALREHCLVKTGHGVFLLPATVGFVSAEGPPVVNPSYWIWPAFEEFSSIDTVPQWKQLRLSGLEVLSYARFGRLQLTADWLQLSDPVAPWSHRPARFGYEAIRVPLFLAWARESSSPALRASAEYMNKPGFPAWTSLEGKGRAEYAAPAGFEAVAKLARRSVDAARQVAVPQVDGDYYSSSLALLSGLAAHDLGWL